MHLFGFDQVTREWELYRVAALGALWSVYWTYLILSKRIRFSVLALLLYVSVFALIFGNFAYNRYRDALPYEVKESP